MWLKTVIFVVGVSMSCSQDVGGVLSGNRLGGVPLGLSLSEGELDVEGICSQQGMACQNCSLAIKCVVLPIGWLKIALESCGEGLSCNAHLGSCTEQHVPECDAATSEYQHTCEQIGMFPDAHDCRKFHICSPPADVPTGRPADHRTALCPRHYGYNPATAQCSVRIGTYRLEVPPLPSADVPISRPTNHKTALCPRHYGYNPATAQCSILLKNGQCEKRPVPACTKIGQTGVLPGSPNHYFVCRMKYNKLHPQVFICPHGWFFVDGFCRPEPETKTPTTEPTNDATENTRTADAPTEKTTEISRIDSFFSTEKSSTYKADTFLADKFDLTNYEITDDEESRGTGVDSWEINASW